MAVGFEVVLVVTHRLVSVEETEGVLLGHLPVETRLETAKAKMARLQELLAAATSVEDMITIEREISDTQYQIDAGACLDCGTCADTCPNSAIAPEE